MTHKINFTPCVIQELKVRLSSEKSAKIYRRLLWIDLKRRGYRQKESGVLLNVSQAQLTNWSKIFVLKGFEGLCSVHYEDRRPSRLMPYLTNIKDYVRDSSVPTLSSLQHWIAQEHGIFIEQSWLSRFIKKNSIVLTKRPI
jgi:transposase